MRFLGIKRKTEFSPNHVVSDSLIFEKTASALEALGAEVERIDERDVTETTPLPPLVFSMAQGPLASRALAAIEKRTGCLIVNSPQSVMNCHRVNMVQLLPAAKVPFPTSVVIDTHVRTALSFDHAQSFWVKRGDVHAVHQEDVVLARSPEEAMELLEDFQGRGIGKAILQQHVPGATVKFYGLRGEDFFHWFAIDGTPVPFDASHLRELGEASARALGLFVYGGDVIVREDGSMVVIDVNDWPSFGPVREQAGERIARLLHAKSREHAAG